MAGMTESPQDSLPQVRALTAAEVALAASVFGAALDMAAVTVRRAKWWAWQPWWVTMAPDGHVWCHPNGFNWRRCYAAEPLGLQAHFIHELVHVWQVQTGGHLALRRPPFAPYRYTLTPGKPFGAYGIEQQASIVADAFLLRAGAVQPALPALANYAAVIPFGSWHAG